MVLDAHHNILMAPCALPPTVHEVVEVRSSCTMWTSWRLPVTWRVGTRSASIMPTSLAHGRALLIMRRLISPSSMMLLARRGDHMDWTDGATSKRIVSEPDVGLTSDQACATRNRAARTARAMPIGRSAGDVTQTVPS